MARLFDRSVTEHIQLSGQPLTGYPLAIGGWVYPDNITVRMFFANYADVSDSEGGFTIGMAGDISGDPAEYRGFLGGSGGMVIRSTSAIPLNTWTHILGYSAGVNDHRLYINGVLETSSSSNVTFDTGIDTFTVGARNKSTTTYDNRWSGGVAEVLLHSGRLTTNDITRLSLGHSARSIKPSGIAIYMDLVRGVFNRASSGVATITGTTLFDHPRVICQCPSILSFPPVAQLPAEPFSSYTPSRFSVRKTLTR